MDSVDRIKVLVVHEDPIAHAGLSSALGRFPDLDVVDPEGTAADEGLDSQGRGRPVDVIVADYANGVAFADLARNHGGAASARVVVVASTDREWDIRRALESGVHGYILTRCALDDLAESVRSASRGARHLSPGIAARLAESMALEPLTAREEQVLRLVVGGLCNKAISRKLNIAVGTVKSHLKATFDKLGVDSRTQAVAIVVRRGLLGDPTTDGEGALAPAARSAGSMPASASPNLKPDPRFLSHRGPPLPIASRP
jgi:DNA-binding NarL/FixJ family response regulator